ncbi:4-hydroxybutyrate CoA-transferase [Candidatus Magnetomorum sp. HK-1]|nr:4-hydroxybutyrate CoA-transferase [Candidatus Magnetomorum sp. HK-1]
MTKEENTSKPDPFNLDHIKDAGKKVRNAERAISEIKRGSRVFLGTGSGEPQHLIHTLVNDKNMYDIMIYQMLSSTLAEYINDESIMRRFFIKLFFISARMRQAAFEGKIDYIPAYLSEIPKLFQNNHIGLDVALVQVSPPCRFGFCSLGVSVDVTLPAIQASKMIIAQVNPKMPRTLGDSFVHVDQIDYLVPFEEPLVTASPAVHDPEVALRIGFYVSELIEDGATLQIGFGSLPSNILPSLENKKDLGLHTQMVTDDMIPLLQKGVITNAKKTLLPGKVVTSLCGGTEAIYDYVHNNPLFYFRSSDFVSDPNVIAKNDNFVSISSALEVDLTGQICTDSVNFMFYSGIGDQADFIRGAAMSRGGFSIIALPSTAKNGTVSRIVSNLSAGAGVGTLRGDVNFVVTEYGIAELYGKGIYQRVMELSQIAHPKFRDELIDKAKKHHYIFKDQIPPHKEDLLFLERYKSHKTLKNGKSMAVRPILSSDEFAYRNFFYSLKEETVYYRFFQRIKVFSHEMAQKHWSSVDYRKNISLIGLVRNKGRKEIMSIGSYAEAEDKRVEIAFVVREDFQSQGVASYLLDVLEKIAEQNGYIGFTAIVLRDNQSMLHVFKKRYPKMKVKADESGDLMIIMDFATDKATTNDPEPKSDTCNS